MSKPVMCAWMAADGSAHRITVFVIPDPLLSPETGLVSGPLQSSSSLRDPLSCCDIH